MKRLILCFDGTWSALTDPKVLTNVVKLADLVTVSHDGVPQITYYNSGVGTGGRLDQFLGGVFGYGLKGNVKRGLTFLALNWEAGDEIYLFGFSRGAYTARALAGVIGAAGIPVDIKHAEHHWNRYQQIAKLQPKRGTPRDSEEWRKAQAAIDEIRQEFVHLARNVDDNGNWQNVPIKCVGVWDTVGSYGVPSGFGLGALPFMFTYWTRGFRDTQFGRTVEVGLHAIAVDERRRPFMPTFWTLRPRAQDQPVESPPNVQQVWFAGVHANVGGGYENSGLSDLSLAWMLAQVHDRTGLRFNDLTVREDVWPCSAGTLYTSSRWNWINPYRSILPKPSTGLRARLLTWLGWRRRQSVRLNEQVHWSVSERLGWPQSLVERGPPCRYAPPNLRGVEAFTAPLPLEAALANHKSGRQWTGKCPMEQANLACHCKARDVEAMQRVGAAPSGGPAGAPPSPSIAA
jgi:uncharacterized protein (DUF2235 family)